MIALARATKIATIAVASVLAIATASSGMHFVWCAPMQHASFHSCCARPTPQHDPFVSATCCESRTAATLPTSASTSTPMPAVLPTTRIALLTIAEFPFETRQPISATQERDRRARASPESRVHRDISVFLI